MGIVTGAGGVISMHIQKYNWPNVDILRVEHGHLVHEWLNGYCTVGFYRFTKKFFSRKIRK